MNSNDTNDFAVPASGGGWKPAESLGHLLVIYVNELVQDVSTSYGQAEALRCTVHDITRRESFDDALIFTGSIIGALRSLVGKRVIVRLEHGKAKPGQNPPYVLAPRNEDNADVDEAMAYLAAREGKQQNVRSTAPKDDPELQAAIEELMRRKMTKDETPEQIPF